MKKAVLKNFTKFTGNLQACNVTIRRLQHRGYTVNISKF